MNVPQSPSENLEESLNLKVEEDRTDHQDLNSEAREIEIDAAIQDPITAGLGQASYNPAD